jgi:DNA-binding PadR family transcriptional regulator
MTTNVNDLTVLGLLAGEPLHPYEMARRMHAWHIEHFTGSRRAALYHAVARLQRAGLVEQLDRVRDGARPERTTYGITPAGRERLLMLLREMIAEPDRQLPRFAAGLTFMSRLVPAEAADGLDLRAEKLRAEVETFTEARAALPPELPPIYWIELEYALTLRRSELEFVERLLEDIRGGRMDWDPGVRPGTAA